MDILICTNGADYTQPALKAAAELAKQAGSKVDILAVPLQNRRREAEAQVQTLVKTLETANIPIRVIWRTGSLTNYGAHIVNQVQTMREKPYDLVIFGSRGRRGLVARICGSIASQVTREAPASVLVIKEQPGRQKKLLLCTSAGPQSEQTVRFAGKLAPRLDASVTLIHIMSQVPLSDHATIADLSASAEELIKRQSREGAHLSKMAAFLTAKDIDTYTVVRHGLVREEILAEAREGDYDMIIIGAHSTPGLYPFLIEDVAHDILLAAECPVLIVRLQNDEQEIEAGSDL
ncbi:MAG: universal stress protein [Anaerolineales bacterium]